MAQVFSLGNVLSQAEGIKGQRLQNQLGQQQLDARNMLLDQRTQFNPLLQNYLANPSQETFNALAAQAPELAQQAIGMVQGQQSVEQGQFQMDLNEAKSSYAAATAVLKSKAPKALVMNAFPAFVEALQEHGVELSELDDAGVLQMAQAIQAEAGAMLQSGSGLTAETQSFNALTSSMSDADRQKAARIKAGLEPRASDYADRIVMIGQVPHRFDPNSGVMVPVEVQGQQVTPESVADSEAKIAQAKAAGTDTGKMNVRLIDEGMTKITGIDKNLRNIDMAVAAIDKGARTGAVQKFLPNVRAASVELENLQQLLGLDIVGATTFGQLSKGELDLALNAALPTGLDEKELRKWLLNKKAAQQKVRAYFLEQINFLNDGKGTIVDFINQKTETAGLPLGSQPLGDGRVRLPDGTIVERE